MIKNANIFGKISLASGLVLAVTFAVWWSVAAQAADGKHDGHGKHGDHKMMHMDHIKTRAEVEALKPGDAIAMVCSHCKHVMIHHVTKDKSHVKMMTVGHKHTCSVCKGSVKVVGTGKGKGKNQEVKHVCSKCGDNAMFVCATKSGGSKKHHHH